MVTVMIDTYSDEEAERLGFAAEDLALSSDLPYDVALSAVAGAYDAFRDDTR